MAGCMLSVVTKLDARWIIVDYPMCSCYDHCSNTISIHIQAIITVLSFGLHGIAMPKGFYFAAVVYSFFFDA